MTTATKPATLHPFRALIPSHLPQPKKVIGALHRNYHDRLTATTQLQFSAGIIEISTSKNYEGIPYTHFQISKSAPGPGQYAIFTTLFSRPHQKVPRMTVKKLREIHRSAVEALTPADWETIYSTLPKDVKNA